MADKRGGKFLRYIPEFSFGFPGLAAWSFQPPAMPVFPAAQGCVFTGILCSVDRLPLEAMLTALRLSACSHLTRRTFCLEMTPNACLNFQMASHGKNT